MIKWNDDDPKRRLESVLREVLTSPPTMPLICPICARNSVHVVFYAHEDTRRAGSWVWCSTCHSFTHDTILVPRWWRNTKGIPNEAFHVVPDGLDRYYKLIDDHWNSLQRRRTPE